MAENNFIGEIQAFAFGFSQECWLSCDGRQVPIADFRQLYEVIGDKYGQADPAGKTFYLPDLNGRVLVGAGTLQISPGVQGDTYPLGSIGGAETVTLSVGQLPSHNHMLDNMYREEAINLTDAKAMPSGLKPVGIFTPKKDTRYAAKGHLETKKSNDKEAMHSNMQPYLGINYGICYSGYFPKQATEVQHDGNNYLGEIRVFAFNYNAPKGWLKCDGQLLKISEYQQLYSLIGNSFGGDGRDTFAIPDLCGRVMLGTGKASQRRHWLGESQGHDTVLLKESEVLVHEHGLNLLKRSEISLFSRSFRINDGNVIYLHDPITNPLPSVASQLAELDKNTISRAGGSEPHENRMPYLVLNACICVNGEYPTRSFDDQ